jgi:hypothetical protein
LNKVSELIKKIHASRDNAWEAKLLHNYYRPQYLSYISMWGYLMFQLTLLSVTAEERALLEQDESNQIYGFVDLADIKNLLEKLFSDGGIEIPGNWEYIKEGIDIVLSSQR